MKTPDTVNRRAKAWEDFKRFVESPPETYKDVIKDAQTYGTAPYYIGVDPAKPGAEYTVVPHKKFYKDVEGVVIMRNGERISMDKVHKEIEQEKLEADLIKFGKPR